MKLIYDFDDYDGYNYEYEIDCYEVEDKIIEFYCKEYHVTEEGRRVITDLVKSGLIDYEEDIYLREFLKEEFEDNAYALYQDEKYASASPNGYHGVSDKDFL